jgi:hypothetical protein
LQVKNEFNQWIDKFTRKIVESVSTVGDTQLKESDAIFAKLVKNLQDHYKEIIKIFYSIQVAPADRKLDTINSFQQSMLKIDKDV